MEAARYRPEQRAPLLALYRQLYPDERHPEAALDQLLAAALAGNGRCWTLTTPQHQLAGFAAITPVPGLPGLFDLDGGIAPAFRRQGHATRLLHRLLQDLPPLPVRRLSHCVPDLDTPAARFLHHRHFTVEHEEAVLSHPNLPAINDLPPATCHLPCTTRSLPRRQAIPLFCTLYERSFAPTPWHQPYTPAEVTAALQQPQDLLFLWQEGAPIGFAWLHVQEEAGEIEPFGIVPERQGRGNGRFLLTAALHHLVRRGVKTAKIGAWRNNHAALHLYRQLGFRQQETRIYLGREI